MINMILVRSHEGIGVEFIHFWIRDLIHHVLKQGSSDAFDLLLWQRAFFNTNLRRSLLLKWLGWNQTISSFEYSKLNTSQSSCTPLTAGKLPTVRSRQGDCQWPLKNSGNPHRSIEPRMHRDWGNHKQHLDQMITKGWCQPTGGHVSWPNGSPIATRLGPCSNIFPSYWCCLCFSLSIFVTLISSSRRLPSAIRAKYRFMN